MICKLQIFGFVVKKTIFFIILCNLWGVWKQSEASQSVCVHSLAGKEKIRFLKVSFMSLYGDLREKKESWKFLT